MDEVDRAEARRISQRLYGHAECVVDGCNEPVMSMNRDVIPASAEAVYMCEAHRANWHFGAVPD